MKRGKAEVESGGEAISSVEYWIYRNGKDCHVVLPISRTPRNDINMLGFLPLTKGD